MMIAAVHLRSGDVIEDRPPSDESDFDVIYNGRHADTSTPAVVYIVEPRSGNNTRRFISMIDGIHCCWDNSRLINVTQRNAS